MRPATTALADQVAAASRDADHLLDTLVLGGMQPGATRPDRWLRRLVDDATRNRCPHLGSPQTCYVVAHQRRLACARCQHAAALAVRNTAEDGTCDRCRRRQPGDLLTTAATTAGPVVILLGLCSNCLPRVHREPATTRPTTRRNRR